MYSKSKSSTVPSDAQAREKYVFSLLKQRKMYENDI